MAKRNLLITFLILITVSTLGTALFFYNQTKHQSTNPQTASTSEGSGNTSEATTPVPKDTPAGEETTVPQTSSAQTSLQAQIEQKYTERLQSVGSAYQGKLNGLAASAFSDYQSAKTADPNADLTPLTNKYYAAGQALEAECDAEMYAIMSAFESELRVNSFPVDAAAGARAAYDAAKANRAGQLLTSKP